MKRLSTKLISTSTTSFSGNFTTQFTTYSSSSSSSISKSPIQNLKPCSNSNGLSYKPYKTHQFHQNPPENYSTGTLYYVESTPYYVGITPSYPSDHSKIENNRSLIQEAVTAAKSAEQMLEDFMKYMEDKFDKGDIGLACLNISLQLAQEGEDPQKIISFANKSLVLLENVEKNNCCLPVAMTLLLLGFTNCSLRKFNDALGFLNRANNILVKLENDDKYEYGVTVKAVKNVLLAVQMDLVDVHIGMRRGEEALYYLRKSEETKGFLKGKDSKELGDANWGFAGARVGGKIFKDGLPYCLKALEIHLRLLRENSVEVAQNRQQLLGAIYAGIDAANMLIACGRYEAALKTLKKHGKGVEENSENPLILMTMANDLVYEENFTEAKGCLEIACRVFDKKKKSKPLKLADQFETMIEIEEAISLLLRTVALLKKLPKKQPLEAGALARMGSLALMTDKATRTMAIPYLERAVEIVKEIYGSKHFGVGYRFNDLGKAYLVLERPESAAEMFAVAKDILDFSLGPHHDDSIHTCQNLSNAYAAMKSYPLAIEFQQKAVDAWEGQGLGGEDKLREARRVLEQLKVSARGASSKDCPSEALPVPHSSNASGGLQAPEFSSSK